MNARFFDADVFRVVEVDQRGTGLSQPSTRDDFTAMAKYADISIAQMSDDFERVRKSLGIERWLVFGGSWGSTLGLDYALSYPDQCLGLILRGIFLNTAAEFDAIYKRDSFLGNARRLGEFGTTLSPSLGFSHLLSPSLLSSFPLPRHYPLCHHSLCHVIRRVRHVLRARGG